MAAMASSSRKRMAVDALPNDCWELVLSKLLNEIGGNNVDEHKQYVKTLSLVSKQLLSVASTFVYSIKLIYKPSSSLISRIFQRFINLTSLDLSTFHGSDINALLSQIPPSIVSRLTSLNLSNHPTFPELGLRFFLKYNNNRLTSLICSNIASLKFTDITFIADSFPFLQHLDLSFPGEVSMSVMDEEDYNNAMNLLPQKLIKLRRVNLSGNMYLNDSSLLKLFINCEFLEEVLISRCPFITHADIAEAIHHRQDLNSFSFTNVNEGLELENLHSCLVDSLTNLKRVTSFDLSFSGVTDWMLKALALHSPPLTKLILQDCYNYTYSGISYLLSKCPSIQHLNLQDCRFLNDEVLNQLCAFLANLVSINVSDCRMLTNSSFFALLTNCPLLTEIIMESTKIGFGPTPSMEDLVVYPQVKSLHLANNSHLQDKHINMFGIMFPNMEHIDLSFRNGVSKQRIATLLKTCRKIRHLKFACFPKDKLFPIKFEDCDLEVLNLSHSRIDDEDLNRISKSFPRLLQLDLKHCYDVTEKGVRQAVENCTRLKEINLQHCLKVSTDIVSWLIFSRPSLRKITAPPRFRPRECDRKLLFSQCLVL